MSKPILIARLPNSYVARAGNDYVNEINKRLSKKLKDYHVLVVVDKRKGNIKFECFNTKDVDTVDFEYLKWYVTEQTR